MQVKLTLRLEDGLIRRAKRIAGRKGKSVSQMVADYFSMLEEPTQKPKEKLPPIVRSLKGALRGADVKPEDYHRHLEEKYR